MFYSFIVLGKLNNLGTNYKESDGNLPYLRDIRSGVKDVMSQTFTK